jgi:hypothetical protein
MKKIFLLLILISSPVNSEDGLMISRTRSMDEVDRQRFYEYKERRRARYYDALAIRRQLNAGKVHKYWTAIIPYYHTPTYYRYNYPVTTSYTVEEYRVQQLYNNYYGY